MNKRLVSMLLTGLLALQLAGCGPAAEHAPPESEGESAPAQVPVTMLYTIDLINFEALVEQTYPDIDLQIERNVMATIDGESERRLRTGHGSDIITTTMPTGDVRSYAMDLSAQRFSSAYQSGISQSLLIDGKTLFLPLPGQYSGYIYNVTLAEQAGVTEPPATTGELLSMLDTAAAKGLGQGEDGVMFAIGSNDMTNVSSYFIGTQVPDFLVCPRASSGGSASSSSRTHSPTAWPAALICPPPWWERAMWTLPAFTTSGSMPPPFRNGC